MSVSLTPIITTAGLQAVLSASNDGLQAKISHVALGDLGWSPTNSATRLKREKNRVPVSNGTRIQPTQIHVTAVENGNVEYWVREVGFVLDDGTLFAIWSHPTQALAWKAAGVDLLLAFDMLLSALPADSVTIDGTGGVNLAPATQTKEGLVRLATSQEAIAGSLNSAVVMSPADSRAHGDARYSRLNHRHPWSEIDGKPATYPSSSHSHSWNSITSKPSTFPASSHNHDDRYPLKSGDYPSLRARATTKADVGLSNVPNYSATSSVGDSSNTKFATAGAVKRAYDRANSRSLGWGSVQITGYLNNFDAVINYTVPNQHVMVGLYSYHTNNTEDRRWRVRYRSISLS